MTALNDTELANQPGTDPSPADTAATRDSSHRLTQMLGDLPENQQEVVRLKFQHQLSYEEISGITGLSITNVGFLLHTALKTLRARMHRLENPQPAR